MIFSANQQTCEVCNRKQKLRPGISTGWYAIHTDTQITGFLCPSCVPDSPAKQCDKCRYYYDQAYSACPYCHPTTNT